MSARQAGRSLFIDRMAQRSGFENFHAIGLQVELARYFLTAEHIFIGLPIELEGDRGGVEVHHEDEFVLAIRRAAGR